MLKRLSKLAEKIREHWKNKYLAQGVSYIIWLFVEILGRLSDDWRIIIDVMGQRALFFKGRGNYVKAGDLFGVCLDISRTLGDQGLEQVYLGELAEVYIKTERSSFALPLANHAVRLAREYAKADLCRRLTERGQILAILCRLEMAADDYREALTPEVENQAHPSHQVGGRLAYAKLLYYEEPHHRTFEDAAFALVEQAEVIARENHLERRLEQIAALKIEWKI